ncbi:hypothetical protein AMTRI_Chr08g159620 [Amborella trichopoda]
MQLCCLNLRRRQKASDTLQAKEFSAKRNINLFSYKQLRSATRNFHPENRIGRGGFGVVYKGILRDETQVAVKLLSAESAQGLDEFLTEIDTISNVTHPNLVKLIGCCIEEDSRMLVYEYLENNSLANALLGSKGKRIDLDWSKRVAICLGTAHGLAFLHEELEPHIVHRDIKASNILLAKDLVPKIGDFGLAKLFPDNVTHLSTRVAGTIGYLAPEYALLGQLTKKADIYSFGILILEIVSGRSSSNTAWAADKYGLLEWIWEMREEGRLLEVVDNDLQEFPEEQALRFIIIALFCTQAASNQRPNMTQVVAMLSTKTPLNEKSLTCPGILKNTDKLYKASGASTSKTSTQKGKQSARTSTSTTISNFDTSHVSMTQLQPR